MASSVELEIIIDKFKELDIQLLVLSENNIDNLSDKWLRELHKMLDKVISNKIVIIINENNIHYKYVKFNNKIINKRLELFNIVDKLMEETTDDTDDTDDLII